jgi:hypothetical protein
MTRAREIPLSVLSVTDFRNGGGDRSENALLLRQTDYMRAVCIRLLLFYFIMQIVQKGHPSDIQSGIVSWNQAMGNDRFCHSTASSGLQVAWSNVPRSELLQYP